MTRIEHEKAYKRVRQERSSAMKQVRELRRTAAAAADTSASGGASASSNNTAGDSIRKTREWAGASDKAVADRRRRLYTCLKDVISRRPPSDHPHAINSLIQLLPVEEKTELRSLSAIQPERCIAQRDLCCKKLRSDFLIPKASLTVRLKNFMPTRAIDRANAASYE
eukprot:3332553-Pleurochrysis_carterae.AAC.3